MTNATFGNTKAENILHYVKFVMLITHMRSSNELSLESATYYNKLALAEYRAKETSRLALKARIYLVTSSMK